jgi:hypothetical protein
MCVCMCVYLETNYAIGIFLNDNHYFTTKTNTWKGVGRVGKLELQLCYTMWHVGLNKNYNKS